MSENNLQELDNIRQHYQILNNLQHEQLIALRKENHELRLKITHEQQRKLIKKKFYEEKLEKLQILNNDASIRLNEGSEVIRKLQKHLKICQEKVIYLF
jgi:predicted oxidoreductase (fatty acid repression mutant protein)